MRRRRRFQWGHGEALRVCTSGRHPRRRTRGKWIRWRKEEDICVASGRIRDGHWDILGLPPPSSTQTRDWENVEQIYIKIFDTRQPPPSGQQPFRRKYENLGGFISQTKLFTDVCFFFSLSLSNYQMGYHQKKIRPGQTALCNNPVDTRPQQKQQPHSHGG